MARAEDVFSVNKYSIEIYFLFSFSFCTKVVIKIDKEFLYLRLRPLKMRLVFDVLFCTKTDVVSCFKE